MTEHPFEVLGSREPETDRTAIAPPAVVSERIEDGWAYYEITREAATLGNTYGLTRPVSEELEELTPEGSAWLKRWLTEKMASHD